LSRKAPPNPLTTRAGEADQDGHPGKMKAKGAAGELKREWRLAHLNNLENIFQSTPALTGITSNFTPQNHRNNEKAPATPKTTRAGGANQDGHPGKLKARGRRIYNR